MRLGRGRSDGDEGRARFTCSAQLQIVGSLPLERSRACRFERKSLRRVRLRSDGSALPRRRSGPETNSPTRGADTPPRAAACPSSPHKMSISKGRMESPEKRRLGTFGSAGSINYPERKAYPEGHPLRPGPGATRHSSLGDHKTLETEALAEVSDRKSDHFRYLVFFSCEFLLVSVHNCVASDLIESTHFMFVTVYV